MYHDARHDLTTSACSAWWWLLVWEACREISVFGSLRRPLVQGQLWGQHRLQQLTSRSKQNSSAAIVSVNLTLRSNRCKQNWTKLCKPNWSRSTKKWDFLNDMGVFCTVPKNIMSNVACRPSANWAACFNYCHDNAHLGPAPSCPCSKPPRLF